MAVISGLGRLVCSLDLSGAASIVRPAEHDLFRLGTNEAIAEGRAVGLAESQAVARSEGCTAGLIAGRAVSSAVGRITGSGECVETEASVTSSNLTPESVAVDGAVDA